MLIDATNPLVETSPKLALADLGDKSASEVVAALMPGARIVKAFNSIVTVRFNEGVVKNGGRRLIFVSGDHPKPTAFVKPLIESFGFTAIDLGGLATGGRLQQAGGPLAQRLSMTSRFPWHLDVSSGAMRTTRELPIVPGATGEVMCADGIRES